MIAGREGLTVNRQLGFYGPWATEWGNIHANSTKGGMSLNANNSSSNGPTIEMHGKDHPVTGTDNRRGTIGYISYGTHNYGHVFSNFDGSGWNSRMAIVNDGRVIIGKDLIDNSITHAPGDYLLYVSKGIMTERARVALSNTADWADFVFAKDYHLMSLGQLEGYIETNKHLPDLPSAEDVVKEGVDLGSMDAKLLQKIEELTLYAIKQQKQIDDLTQQINQLKNK